MFKMKFWKNKNDIEKMNTLWNWFRIMIVLMMLNAVLEIFKNLYFVEYWIVK